MASADTALSVRPDQIEDIYELSPMQQGMLFHTLRDGETAYVEQFSCRLQGPIDVPAFESAWRALIARHPVLRTCFFWEDVERPVQVVLRQVAVPLTVVEWHAPPNDESQARFDALLESERTAGFDVKHAPLLRVRLVQTSPQTHWLAFTHHHLLLDGWSRPLIFDELFILYEAAANGRTADLPPRPPYRDFIAWLRKQDVTGAQTFWRDRLSGLVGPTPLPLGAPHGPGRARFTEHHAPVRRGGLDAWCRERRLTANTLVQAAWALTLARLTGRDEVVFGMTVSGRPPGLPGVESMVGLFINTLPVRLALPPGIPAGAWLEDVQRSLVDLRQFEHTPLARIQEWARDVSPLFETLLVFENYPSRVDEATAASRLTVDRARVFERTNYPLTLVVAPGERLAARLIVDERRIPAVSAGQILRYFDRAIEAIVDDVAGALGNLSLAPPVEHGRVPVAAGRTTSLAQDDRFVVERIEAQAAVAPAAAAVVAVDGRVLSYRDLNGRANRLASYLRAAGILAESRVGICFDRTPDEIVAQLAVLKAGGAYVPFDPAHPPARWQDQAADAGVTIVLTDRTLGALWAGTGRRLLELDRAAAAIATHEPTDVQVPCDQERLAYVIYTSGSTGRPKGVAITHGGLRNLTRWHLAAFDTKRGDRQPHLASPAFDASVWETWPCLAAGGTLYLCPSDLARDPEALCAWLVDRRITSAFAPTPLAEALLALPWPEPTALRRLLTGGDLLHAFPPAGLPFTLVNNYGPTEYTVVATSGPVHPRTTERAAAPPIGTPIANTRAYVVDPQLTVAPTGDEGELCIAGPGLARGYWNAPDRTAERFVPDPFSAEPGARMYRTGDRVRAQPDGGLAFIGRTDHQVKLRGFRIELGEVEHRLRAQAGVRDAVVALPADRPGLEQLVAYVVRDPDVPLDSLRDALAHSLPDHMVPRVWVDLERLPVTVQGKIDRAALSQAVHAVETPGVAPIDPIEAVLAGIWEDVLSARGVGSGDDFFALGGHSLSAMRVLSRIRATWPIDLPLGALFEHTTLTALAADIRGLLRPGVSAVERVGPIESTFRNPEGGFRADGVLPADMVPDGSAPDLKLSPRTILLTGATGFLGVFLLHELLEQTTADILCLVRASSAEDGVHRLKSALTKYDRWRDQYALRVRAMPGDLGVPRFGLSSADSERLAAEVDVIYHNGALVNFIYPYERLKPANVGGTEEVLRLACRVRTKPVHYISTMDVLAGAFYTGGEEDDVAGTSGWTTGYAQSKWVAEQLVCEARARGVPVAIYRPARVVGDSRSGIWNTDDFACRAIKGLVQLGSAPTVQPVDNMLPVDYAAQAIVCLSIGSSATERRAFHVANPQWFVWTRMFDFIRRRGYPLADEPYPTWWARLARTSDDNALKPLLPLLAVPADPLSPGADLPQPDRELPPVQCANTLAGLAGSGVSCPKIDEALLGRYFDAFVRSGFLEPAPAAQAARLTGG